MWLQWGGLVIISSNPDGLDILFFKTTLAERNKISLNGGVHARLSKGKQFCPFLELGSSLFFKICR